MSKKPRDPSEDLLDGGGNIDMNALFHAYEDQGEDDAPVEVTFELQRNHNKRLDAYLAGRIPFLSRTSLQRLITENVVWVNGRNPKASTKLKSGDRVRVILPPRLRQIYQLKIFPFRSSMKITISL